MNKDFGIILGVIVVLLIIVVGHNYLSKIFVSGAVAGAAATPVINQSATGTANVNNAAAGTNGSQSSSGAGNVNNAGIIAAGSGPTQASLAIANTAEFANLGAALGGVLGSFAGTDGGN